jgi:hypothetical protein
MKVIKPGQRVTFKLNRAGENMMIDGQFGGMHVRFFLEPLQVLNLSEAFEKAVRDAFPHTAADD